MSKHLILNAGLNDQNEFEGIDLIGPVVGAWDPGDIYFCADGIERHLHITMLRRKRYKIHISSYDLREFGVDLPSENRALVRIVDVPSVMPELYTDMARRHHVPVSNDFTSLMLPRVLINDRAGDVLNQSTAEFIMSEFGMQFHLGIQHIQRDIPT